MILEINENEVEEECQCRDLFRRSVTMSMFAREREATKGDKARRRSECAQEGIG